MSKRWREWQQSFLAGLLVVVPVVASILILWWLFTSLTNLVLPPAWRDVIWTPLYRLVVLLMVLAGTTALGWVMRWVIGKRLLVLTEMVIGRVPVLKTVYEFLKNISATYLGGERTAFQRVVVVEYPRPGIYTIAFATGDAGGEVAGKSGRRLVSVFLPTPPNPTTGYLGLFPQESVVELEMSVADAMKMAFSGGAIVPPYPPLSTARLEVVQ